jgi:hypothetical protein
MSDPHMLIELTRRHLGELGVMAHKTEQTERNILARAEQLLADIETKINTAQSHAMVGDNESNQDFTDMVEERERLQQVIERAQAILAEHQMPR